MARPTFRLDDTLVAAVTIRRRADGYPTMSALVTALLERYAAGEAVAGRFVPPAEDPRKAELFRLVDETGLSRWAASEVVGTTWNTARKWFEDREAFEARQAQRASAER